MKLGKGLERPHLIGLGGAGFKDARTTTKTFFSVWKASKLIPMKHWPICTDETKDLAPLGAEGLSLLDIPRKNTIFV